MIPYRLLPAYGGDCHIEIEIINPVTMGGMVEIHAEETKEIILDRIIYEITNPFAHNEVFIIDKWLTIVDGKSDDDYSKEAYDAAKTEITAWDNSFVNIGKTFNPDTGKME